MKWSIHIYDPKTETTTTHVKDYPGTSASMADAPAVVAKASRDFKKHMKYILAVPNRGRHATKKKSPGSKKIKVSTSRPIGWTITDPARPGWSETGTTTADELKAKFGTKPRHATKRKSPAELDRDIAEVIGQWEEDRFGHRFVTMSDGVRFDTAAVDPTFYRDPKWRQRWEFDLKREIEKFKAGKPTKLSKMSETHYRLPATI